MLLFGLSLLALCLHSVTGQTVYQAESAQLSGVTVASTGSGYTGTGYVTGFDAASDAATFTVTSPSTQLYDLSITFRAPNGEKYTRVSLNGAGGSEVYFAATTSWTTIGAGQVLLNSGSNTIQLQSHWGWYDIDKITVSPAATRPPHQVAATLVNPNASPEAKTLLAYLISQYGRKILSGQQEVTYHRWVETNIGKSPAILGVDLIDYSPSRVERGTSSSASEEAIAFDVRGGIVTVLWHWNAPSGLIDSSVQPWYRGFYTEATTFDLEQALANKSGQNYQLLIRDIDAIAVQLKKLQSAKVPVLWRPLHEAEGGWFWWGRDKKAAPAKELWNILYDRLTNYHGINNLIWIWNSINPDWYPGAATVDIVSCDSYPAQGDHGPVSASYNSLVALVADKKLVALTEVGSIPDPVSLEAYRADWSWFMTWNGEFIDNGSWNPRDFLQRIYSSAYVLTLDEIVGWKTSNGLTSSSTSVSRTSSTSRSTSSSRTSTTSSTRTSTTSTSSRSSSSTRTSSTTSRTTSSTRTTSSSTRTSSASPTGTQVPRYGQCGGQTYTGSKICAPPYTCQYSNDWYSQCL